MPEATTCKHCGARLAVGAIACFRCGKIVDTGGPSETELGKIPTALGTLARGALFDEKWRLVRPLGLGPLGTVWMGHDLALDRPVAIKVIDARWAKDAGFSSRFEARALAMASIDHRHVAHVLGVGKREGMPFVVTRFIEGGTLAEYLHARGGKLPAHLARRLLSQLCDGLAALHTRGLVHGRVKHANILLGEGDHLWLTDSGEALLLAASAGPSDFAAEIYAVGALGHELLTGRAAGSSPLPLPEAPPDLAQLLAQCLSVDPLARPKNVAAVRDRLGSSGGEGLVPGLKMPPMKMPPLRPPSSLGDFDSEPAAAPNAHLFARPASIFPLSNPQPAEGGTDPALPRPLELSTRPERPPLDPDGTDPALRPRGPEGSNPTQEQPAEFVQTTPGLKMPDLGTDPMRPGVPLHELGTTPASPNPLQAAPMVPWSTGFTGSPLAAHVTGPASAPSTSDRVLALTPISAESGSMPVVVPQTGAAPGSLTDSTVPSLLPVSAAPPSAGEGATVRRLDAVAITEAETSPRLRPRIATSSREEESPFRLGVGGTVFGILFMVAVAIWIGQQASKERAENAQREAVLSAALAEQRAAAEAKADAGAKLALTAPPSPVVATTSGSGTGNTGGRDLKYDYTRLPPEKSEAPAQKPTGPPKPRGTLTLSTDKPARIIGREGKVLGLAPIELVVPVGPVHFKVVPVPALSGRDKRGYDWDIEKNVEAQQSEWVSVQFLRDEDERKDLERRAQARKR
jgi:serine/threonine protein kinase, bacterial